MMFSLNEIVRVTSGQLLEGNGLSKVKGVSIDSRRVKKHDVFIAVKGLRYDGHDFIEQALRRGAGAVIVSKKKNVGSHKAGVICVEDTIKALGLLARAHRDRFKIPVIAITGSTGKTTTKELISCVLKARFKVLRNSGTQNNHIGVPLTLLQMKFSHEMAVLEFGTNQFGDIEWLTQITRPEIAVLTNIGESHLEVLKNPRNVFREKLTLVQRLPEGGAVFYNEDDPFLRTIPRCLRGRSCIKYGITRGADFTASEINGINNKSVSFKVEGHNFILQTPVLHNVHNALAAIACGRTFNLSFRSIDDSLKRFSFKSARQNIQKKGKIWLIDDTYNANPVSLRSALRTLAQFHSKGRRILVCADMLELGTSARALHHRCGQMAGRLKLDHILTYGKLARHISQGAKSTHKDVMTRHFTKVNALNEYLADFCQAGDVVLVKGSRGMHMERVVHFLQNKF